MTGVQTCALPICKSELPGDTDQIKKMREDGKRTMEEMEREQRSIIEDADTSLQAIREERGVSYTKKEKPEGAKPGTPGNPIKLK